MQTKWLTWKWITIKRYKQIIRKVLHIIKQEPNFETIFLDWIIYWQTYEEIKSYCEVLWMKIGAKKIKYRIHEFAPAHLYWDYTSNFHNKWIYDEFWEKSVLQKDIIIAIQNHKQSKEDKKDKEEKWIVSPKERIQKETKIFAYLLNKPQAMEMNAKEIAKLTNVDDEKLIEDIMNWDITPAGTKAQELLLDKNYQILEKWKKKILEKMDKINPEKFQDLKALSDILDTAFKQNRLIEWKSTENAMIGVTDIYDAIIQNADEQKKELDF